MHSRKTRWSLIVRGGVGVLCTTILLAAAASMGAEGAPAGAPRWSWQEEHARVLPTGGLEWAPRPFVFERGSSLRYIDFAAGDDAEDGKTQQTAWKHHPWDAKATGEARACKGVQTYVFKGGVVYRGALTATESGTPGDPIRLTRDPNWGSGEAILCGSTQIRGGWKKANAEDAPGIPEPANVWYLDLGQDYDPDPEGAKLSAMWQVDGDKVERLHIAREPNYELSDPNNPVKKWPVWSAYDVATGTFTSPFLKGLGDRGLLNGAVLWTEGGFLMAAASKVPIPAEGYDPDTGSVTIPSRANIRQFRNIPRAEVHFMVENVAALLNAAGEYYLQLTGPTAGRLYLRPADGVDPNSVVYEVAQTRFLIRLTDLHDVVVSGLEFRYNDPDDGTEDWPSGASPCVRITGNCANVTVSNCRFYYVADAVTACPRPGDEGGPANDVIDNIIVSDNDIQNAEKGGAIHLAGAGQGVGGGPSGLLKHAEVLRNRLIDTGFRHGSRTWSSIPAISVSWPETCEIAGNIVDTSFGNGIITYGGKRSGARNVVPLTRMFVHHNQLDNTMLGCNDYGGLEHFQGGPIYIYNNITRNCVGNRTLGREVGYSLYLDGGFKCYSFNNIIAGNVKADQPDYYNQCGYFMVFGFMDQLFNNTIYRFDKGLDGSSGNRSNIVGNLMLDCSQSFIRQNRPGDVSMLGGGDTGAMGSIGIPTMSYASNVFFGHPTDFGYVAGVSRTGAGGGAPVVPGKTLEELRDNLQAQDCRLASIGWQVDEPPLVDPAKRDYRPTVDSGARERGVKYFVPWALARNVGEWNFYKSASSPQCVLGEGFCMTDEYRDRGMYYFIPRNDLTVSACSEEDYVAGPLEDWIEGALVFDGRDRVASLSHAEMTRSMEYPARRRGTANTYDGSKRETLDMGVNSFLIEIVFRTDAGAADGVLASKLGEAGYELAVGDDGRVRLTLQGGDGTAAATSTARINDGEWHHVIAEVDRTAGKATLYVDGKAAGQQELDAIAGDATLSNTADFVVGKGFAGAVDFLRVCRSTLAESKTSIEELYAWEFDGPFLRDFCGVRPAGKRDAGAMEYVGP